MDQITPETLPDDPAELKRMLLEQRVERDAFAAERDAFAARCDVLVAERDGYKSRLEAMLRRMFGKRAETLDPAQLELFAEEVQRIRDEAGDESQERLPTDKKKPKRKPKREALPAHLPRVTVEHDVPEDEKPCPCCAEERVVIARESSEQLEIKPIEVYVVRHERLVYACPTCRDQIQRAEKPHQPVERSIAGPSLLAYLVTSKFEDHLPLYRIEKMLKRAGVTLPRSTQVGLMHKTAELVKPLVDLMWKKTRGSPVIHTDDTTMPTQEKGRGKTRTGRLWPYIGRHGAPWDVTGSYVVVHYTNSRSSAHVERHLNGWTGDFLQADCFAGYRALEASGACIHVACWAHLRRKFHEARTTDIARSTRAMAFISTLYDIESEIKEEDASKTPLAPEWIAEQRATRARPIVDDFLAWLETESRAVLPKSPMGQAIAYVLNHRDAFGRYLDDGRLAIDNNLAERMIRPIAVGRKNFLFAGSDQGGRTMATLMSLVCSARLQGLDVQAYVADVITRIATLPVNDLDTLLPDLWKAPRAERAGD